MQLSAGVIGGCQYQLVISERLSLFFSLQMGHIKVISEIDQIPGKKLPPSR
jgi:hypothetical protein